MVIEELVKGILTCLVVSGDFTFIYVLNKCFFLLVVVFAHFHNIILN